MTPLAESESARARRRAPARAALAALLLGASACTPGNRPPEAAFDEASTPPAARPLVVAWDADLGGLDPAHDWCDACASYFGAVYEGLLDVGAGGDGDVVARLARSWSAAPDLRSYTFELDPQARFADGTPVEAADVVWSWQRVAASAGPASQLLDGLAELRAEGPGTVVALFEGPNSDLPAIATSPYLGVLNRDLALTQPDGPDGEVDLTAGSVGSGPYVLEGYVRREQLRLARNRGHWSGVPAGPDQLVVRAAPADGDGRALLESGRADVAVQLAADVAERIEPSGDLVVVELPSPGLVHLVLSPGAPGGEALTDEVRREVAARVDRAAVLEHAADDAGEVAATVIPPGFPGAPPGGARPDAAGHAGAPAPADVALAGAFPVTTTGGVDLTDVAEAVEDQLAALGVVVELRGLDPPAWRAVVDGPGVAVTVAYAAPAHPGSSQFVRLFGRVPGSLWGGRAGGGEPLVDDAQVALLHDALAAEGAAAQAAPYAELAQAIGEDAVVVPLFRPDLLVAHRSDVTGVRSSTCCPLDLRSLALRA